jgi:hypothetical protein
VRKRERKRAQEYNYYGATSCELNHIVKRKSQRSSRNYECVCIHRMHLIVVYGFERGEEKNLHKIQMPKNPESGQRDGNRKETTNHRRTRLRLNITKPDAQRCKLITAHHETPTITSHRPESDALVRRLHPKAHGKAWATRAPKRLGS